MTGTVKGVKKKKSLFQLLMGKKGGAGKGSAKL